MAEFDLPALLSYIEEATGTDEFIYIGHNFGTTQMFAALSENPEYFRNRMKTFIAIGPTVRLKNQVS